AVLAADGTFGVWQVEPWRELGRWSGADIHEHGIVFDPPGKRVFVVGHEKGVVVGDLDSGRTFQMAREDNLPISHLDVSSDNRFVATSSWAGTVVLWAFAPGEEPRPLATIVKQRIAAWSVAFSPDNQRLAVGLANGQIQIWDLQ